jgi:hypothetical protein
MAISTAERGTAALSSSCSTGWSTCGEYYYYGEVNNPKYTYQLEKDSSERYEYHWWTRCDTHELRLTRRVTDAEILAQLDFIVEDEFPLVNGLRRRRA